MKIKKSITVTFCAMIIICFGAVLAVGCAKPQTYTVTIANYNLVHGTVSLDHSDKIYEAGQEATVTVKANEGYSIQSFTVDNEDKLGSLNGGVYKFTVQKDVNIAVSFKRDANPPENGDPTNPPEEKDYKITVESVENGVVTLSEDKTSFKKDEKVTAVLRPNKGYEIKSFFVGDDDCTFEAILDGEYEFTVTGDMTVKAPFAFDDLTEIQDVSVKGFKRITDNNEYVIVDFWATWCNACEYTNTALKEVAAENLGIKIVKMDIGPVNENPPERDFFFKYAKMYGNTGNTIPAFVIFKNGQPVAGTHETSPFGFTADGIKQFITDNIK